MITNLKVQLSDVEPPADHNSELHELERDLGVHVDEEHFSGLRVLPTVSFGGIITNLHAELNKFEVHAEPPPASGDKASYDVQLQQEHALKAETTSLERTLTTNREANRLLQEQNDGLTKIAADAKALAISQQAELDNLQLEHIQLTVNMNKLIAKTLSRKIVDGAIGAHFPLVLESERARAADES
jgi:hypothetical protein